MSYQLLISKIMLITGFALAAILIADAILGRHASEGAALLVGVAWCVVGVPVVYLLWRMQPRKGVRHVRRLVK